MNKLNKDQIISLLPHREPMLLIDELYNIKKLFSNFFNSISGLKIALTEHSFIIEIISGIFLIPFLIFVEIEIFLKILILVIYLLMLGFELINTVIEKLSDKI